MTVTMTLDEYKKSQDAHRITDALAHAIDAVAKDDYPWADVGYGTCINLMIARAAAESLLARWGSAGDAAPHIPLSARRALLIVASDPAPYAQTDEYQDHLNLILRAI